MLFHSEAGSLVILLLFVVFLGGALINGTGSKAVRNLYLGWGYPPWFCFVTAILELLTAALMILPMTRMVGLALGVLVTAAAAITLVRNHEYTHAIAPTAVFLLTVWAGWVTVF